MDRLTIFHTNDLHNRKSVFSYFKDNKRDENSLLFDSGDAIGGSNTLFYLREPVLDDMNEAGYNAMAMGNREFHYLRSVLRARRESVKFPILSANLKDLSGKSDGCWKDSAILKVVGLPGSNGITVGIAGLTPVQFPGKSFLTKITGFLFISPEDALPPVIKKLRDLGVDIIIVLSHLGLRDDKKLAEKLKGIDLIIGGHSHSIIEKPIIINNTYIFQAGSHGNNIGRIDIVYNRDKGLIDSLNYEMIKVEYNGRREKKTLYSLCNGL